MFKNILVLIFFSMSLTIFGQGVEEEVGFIYVKAEYMMETQRYAEASKQYGEVIRLQPAYKDALLKRAMAKYEMASYRGVKDDVANYIKRKGITPDAVRLLGLCDYKLGNFEAAENSLSTAILLFPKDGELYYARGESLLGLDRFEEACSDWDFASKRGVNSAKLQANKYCNDIVSRPRDTKPGGTKPGGTRKKPSNTGRDKVEKPGRNGTFKPKPGGETRVDENEDDLPSQTRYEEEEEVDMGPPVDDSVNNIEVDEDLSLQIRDGLGSREVLQQPNILILSDSSGDVAVDVCINDRGRVSTADFNKAKSTLDTRSIVSLAVRKAQEFWFEKSEYEEMCGTIVFKIGGR